MAYPQSFNQGFQGYNQNGYYYNQPINPYIGQERFNVNQPQMQVMQPLQNNNFIKVVDGIESVKVSDIPMDYNMYYFAKPDGSELYSKCWNKKGGTDVRVYKPLDEVQNSSVEENLLIEKLNAIESKMGNIEKMFSSAQQKPVVKNKKEAE